MENTKEVHYWEVSLCTELHRYEEYRNPAQVIESANRMATSVTKNIYDIQDATIISTLRILTKAMQVVRRDSHAATFRISEIIAMLQKKQGYRLDEDGKPSADL
ncbi:hypothetical protein K8942_03305 [Candidatus Peribacteria bacterium]|nr:MAG: hypothetical protein K8942_03305 [Candidatus Peribacteria bacterium]